MSKILVNGLQRMYQVLSGHVERGEVPGLVALVSNSEDMHVEALGVKRDTIFRIASLSKPVTAVAAMILVEDCRMRLDDPIDPWLPELANRRVLKSIGAKVSDTVPAKRPITVRDLLTLRMGLGSVMAAPDTYPIQKLIRESQIGGDGPPRPATAPATEEWLRRLGSLPLIAQPGEKWMYHVGSDVLGVLVARVSGQPLGKFMRERIFEPLGMKDTAFFVPDDKLGRFTPCFIGSREIVGALEVFDDVQNSAWRLGSASELPFESGGGGLTGTVDDYFAFCRMMLHRGRHGREQILSPASVELMTSDQLTAEQRAGSEIFFGTYSSWGMGTAVDIARREIYHSPGRFGWTGGLGTTAYTDPAKGVIGILFTLRCMDSPQPPKVFSDFWTSAYAALQY